MGYKIRDKIFPANTRRRLFAKTFFYVIKDPKGFLAYLNKTNFKKFIYYLKTSEPSVLEEKVVRKFSMLSCINEPSPICENLDENITLEKIENLNFPIHRHPLVSIIIPVWNKWTYTYGCLKTILENTDKESYEVIVYNNACTDETSVMIRDKVKNIKVINSLENIGFILACNESVDQAAGDYLVFFNNDAFPSKGWLRALLDIMEKDGKAGAVGVKLVYPDGRLQEAGAIIWNDGSAWNFGRGDNPEKSEYNYVREVDYCSGACLMVKRDLFEQIGRFDKNLAPAYGDDFDLGMILRTMGYKVIYQPKAQITHMEGVTMGIDTGKGLKRYQEINKQYLREKWRNELQKHHFPSGHQVFLARERGKKKRILIIDQYVPEHDKDSGSVRMSWIIKILNELGHKVIFWPDDLWQREPYTSQLQQMGVEVIYGKNSLNKYLAENGKYIDLVWICRRDFAWKYHKTIRKLTNAPIWFDTIDLHYLRELRQAEISGQRILFENAQKSKKMELELANNSDVTLVVSPVEKELLEKEGIFNVEILSNIIHALPKSVSPLDGRKDLMFIGGFVHPPNVDAIMWFVSSIWPNIKKILPDLKFYIVGSNPPPCIKAFANPDIIVTGYQKEVENYFKTSKIFVCPLRFGAGIKGKIGHSMSFGLPVVTTSVGAEGMGLKNGENVLIADKPKDFAYELVRLYNEEKLWNKLSKNSLRYVKENNSPEIAYKKLQEMFSTLLEVSVSEK